MNVSVIIPTFNRKENIQKTLKCLWEQEIQPQHGMEIIIVDHASTDGTLEALKHLHNTSRFNTKLFRLEYKPYWSPTFPKNYGAKRSTVDSEVLIFVDSDVLLPPHVIQRYIDIYLRGKSDPNRVIIAPYHQLHHTVSPVKNWWKNKTLLKDYTQDVRWEMIANECTDFNLKYQGERFALACYGGNILIPRKLFFKAGGFDEKCTEGEDGDLGLTLWECGATVSMDAGLLGWHNPHEIVTERRQTNWDTIHYIDAKHHIDNVRATGKAMRSWGIDWMPDDRWLESAGYTKEDFEREMKND